MVYNFGERDFDFLLSEWDILNKRKNVKSLYLDPERNNEAEWEEFPAKGGMGTKLLDGRVLFDHFEGTFPNGKLVKGVTIRAYNETTGEWAIVWLDNRQPPDFTPLVGRFENGIGQFEQVITTEGGKPLHVRFVWDSFTEKTARWQQLISLDEGGTWEVNWIMEFTRRP